MSVSSSDSHSIDELWSSAAPQAGVLVKVWVAFLSSVLPTSVIQSFALQLNYQEGY